MKKLLSIMLLACMTLGIIPAFMIAANGSTSTPLGVTHVSMSKNYHENKGDAVNWALAWNSSNTTRVVGQIDEDFYVIGKFDAPTRVTDLTLCISYYSARCNGINISLSVDGTDWVDVATVMNRNFNQNEGKIHISTPAAGDTKYEYVKVWRKVDTHNGAVVSMWVDFMWIAFYDNSASDGKAFVEVEHVSAASTAQTGIGNVWDFSNTSTYKVTGTAKGEVLRGKFEYPTVLSDIYIKKEDASAHMNHTAIEASVDGENWVEIVKISSDNMNTMNLGKVLHVSVSDTTMYNYVRVIRNQSYSYWYAIGIGFYGEEHPEAVERVEARGFQRTTAVGDTYSLRFICSVDSTEYTDIGMKISCNSENGGKWDFDVKADTLLEGISEKKNGEDNHLSAEQIGGVALYAAVIENVPVDIGFFSADITPYYTVDGVKKEGKTKTVVMKNSDVVKDTEYKLEEEKGKIKIYGRSAELEEGIACDFTASGIEFNARLAGDIYLTVNASAMSYYTLYIDGVEQEQRLTFYGGTAEYLIAKGLPAKEYNIRLVKQTHVAHSISSLVSLRMKGELGVKPADDALMIEFIGDSITCGYGTVNYPDGVSSYSGPKYCDATKAYAFKTAELLEADYSMISVSGWAVLPDANGGSCVPNIYVKESYQRLDASYTPDRNVDIVVIHLGTNDINSRGNYETDFVDASVAFVSKVKEMNPNAKIIWIYGSMLTSDRLSGFEAKVQDIVEQCGGSDADIWSLKVPYNQSAGNGHPSDEGHTQTARVLYQFIKDNGIDQ